jgi:adenylate cyclase
VGFLARVLPGLYAIACCALIAAASAAVALHVFTEEQLLVPLAVPMLVQLPLGLFVGLLSRYRDLRKQVPAELDPHGRQQLLRGVCLATDVKGYTSLTEHLTRDQLHDLLDEYHEMLRRLVHAHQGLVWGRGGDSALCVWKSAGPGAWLPEWLRRRGRADQIMRLSACLAAIEIRDAIDAFNRRHAASQQLPTRMGLDVGEIGLGAVAGELQAVGSPVNTAARIEGLNRHLATKLLASASVVQGLDGLAVRPVGLFALAGKSDSTAIVEILGLREAVPATHQDICQPFAEALERFADGAWADAARLFRALHQTHPDDGPTFYYLSLSERYRTTPPESGMPIVIHLDSK